MKHIVFICTQYLPNPTPDGVIVSRIIKSLREQYPSRIRFSVLTKKSNNGEKDFEVINGARVSRINTSEIYLSNLFNADSRLKQTLHKLIRVPFIFFEHFQRTSVNKSVVRHFQLGLRKINKANNIDIIIPLCFPFESIVASNEFIKSHKSISVFPYLIDKFSYSQTIYRTKINKKIKLNRNLALEIKELNKSTGVLSTYNWKEIYNKQLKIKLYSIYLPLIDSKGIYNKMPDEQDIHYQIFFAGSLSKQMRPIGNTMQIMKKIFETDPDMSVKVLFYVKGNLNKELNSVAKYKWFSMKFNQTLDRANEEERSSKFLLSIGNIDIQQVPSKIFEYITTLKPIIHVYQNDNDPVISILRKYPNSCLLDGTDHSDSDKEAEKLRHFINSPLKKVNIEDIMQEYIYADFTNVSDRLLQIVITKNSPRGSRA